VGAEISSESGDDKRLKTAQSRGCEGGAARHSARTSLMHYSDYFLGFGLVSLVLGILGYVRARSVASLYAGGLSGILLAASALMAARRASAPDLFNYGYLICLLLSAALLGRFLPGFLKTKKLYPAGLMALLSVLGVAAGILALSHSGPFLP
jgi:uncharacterized membrane protein (UPF0136 family)